MRLARASTVFLFLVATSPAQDQQYVISTYAGGGPLPARIPANNLSIDWNSKALAVDAAGNVYFTSLNCVFKLGRDGIVTRIAGNSTPGYSGDGGPAASALFSMAQIVGSPPYLGSLPPGLAVDNAGNVYVADNGNSRIRKISPDGTVTTVAGNGTFGFSGDGGPAVRAQLSSVLGLAVDAAGNLLLTDSDNHRVRLVAPDGTIASVAGNGDCGLSGDGGPAALAQLCNPSGMAMDNTGNLFIADRDNNRIRKVSPDGIITTVAGNGKRGYSGDGGRATDAAMSSPVSVAVDAAGNIYFADLYNNVLRVLRPKQPGGQP